MDESANPVNDTPEGWGEDESRVFVEFGRAMVPGREEIERTFLDLLPAASDEPFVGVEIGTGTGWLCAAVLRTFPGARMVGLDGSKEMLRVAGDVLAAYQDRAELRPFRLEEDSWVEGLPPVRVFLSSLVLHHLDGPGKRGLFARLFDRLEPGGALLFADVMEPRTDLARRHFAGSGPGRSAAARWPSTATSGPASSSYASAGTCMSIPTLRTSLPRCPNRCAG